MPASTVPVSVIGLPYHMGIRAPGAGYQIGFGPEKLLASDALPARLASQFADVDVELITGVDDPTDEDTGGDYRLLPVGDQMSRVLVQNMHLAEAVRTARASDRLPIIAGGTCSSALGTVGGLADDGIGLVWFDAHSDAQTPDTSASGFIEGMPVSIIAGLSWPKWRRQIPGFTEVPVERIITVGNHEIYAPGGRSADFHGGGASGGALGTVVDPPVIARLGFEAALAEALDRLAERTDRVYLHFDADVLDPSVLRANSHAADGGLTDEQCIRGFEMVADRFEIIAFNLSSWDPALDPRGLGVLVPLMAEATRLAAASRSLRPSRATLPR